MHFLFLYLIKLSCSLAVMWLFYRLVLRSLTFYDMNRWYLLGYAALSFLIPLVDIGPALDRGAGDEPLVIQFIPAIGQYAPVGVEPAPGHAEGWPVWNVALCLALAGSLFLLVRIAIRWFALGRLRRRSRLIRGGDWKIYQVDETIAPFSFGSSIYVNRDLHTEKEWEEIILHEYVHVRQRHTVDIILAEWLTILNWYNPFAWLIRHSIRQNLEFIADRKVLDNGADKKGYQYHLLKVIGQPGYRLANNFNFSSLKKRIVMMNKLRSARLHLVKFLFILPLLAVLLVAFRDGYTGLLHGSGGQVYINVAGIAIDVPDQAPLQGVVVRERFTGLQTTTDGRGFYKLRIPVTNGSAHVELNFTKDGYMDGLNGRSLPSVKESMGMIAIGVLRRKAVIDHSAFMAIPLFHKVPLDPSYEDAVEELKEIVQGNADVQRVLAMQKAHPEVALFYMLEGRHRELVVHTDGSIERFGFPDGPTIDDMEKKYGPLPAWLKQDDPGAGSGYLAHWAAISAQAEKDFRPANHSARAIIFPGDSRVLAVDATGKGTVYDMDSDAPEERPAFEKEYGKLPDCVPSGYHYPAMPPSHPGIDTAPAPRRDTLIGVVSWKGQKGDTERMTATLDLPARDTFRRPGKDTVTVILDNPRLPVLDFGERRHSDSVRHSSWPPQQRPLFFVNGVEKDTGALGSLNPNEIMSIDVLKDSTAVARYGPRAKNGVILIKMKSLAPLKP